MSQVKCSFTIDKNALIHGTKMVCREAIIECCRDLKLESQAEVPVDTGKLKNSARIYNNSDANTISYSVGYETPYAIYQHENIEFNHPNGGKSKFLEDPFKRNQQKYQTKIASAVKKKLDELNKKRRR